MKHSSLYPSPLETEPWDSGWIELAGTTSWHILVDKLTRINNLEVSRGKVRRVMVGWLEILPNRLPYPTLEPGMYLGVVGQVGTRFKMTGRVILEPKT